MSKKNLLKVLSLVLALMICAISFVGCSKTGGTSSSGDTAAKDDGEKNAGNSNLSADADSDKEKIKIGLPVYTMEHPYYIALVDAAKKEAEKLGVELLVSDSSFDAVKQVAITENMVAQGVKALIMCAVDPQGIIPTLVAAEQKGVKIIVEGNPLEKDGKPYGETFVGVDNYSAAVLGGEYAGKYINEKLGGKAKIAIISHPVEPVCIEREDGFVDGVKKVAPGAEVVASQSGETVRDKSMAVMENILTANPDINVVYGINDDSALGALAAMEARGMGKKNEIVIGFDGTKDGIDAIKKNGMFKADVFQPADTIGEECVRAAIKVINGEKLPEHTKIDVALITYENVDQFIDK